MKIIAGAFFLAAANSSLTRLAKESAESPRSSRALLTSHAHKHLVKAAPAGEEERHLGLSRYRAGEHRLAGSGRTSEEHAFGQLPAEGGEFLRVSQKLDELFELLQTSRLGLDSSDHATHRLGLLDAVDIAKLDDAAFFRLKLDRAGTCL